ncbi:hypothetical protein [Luteolibacter arcticus]|nr:hypothetical protein [Luteolibacter arcticus]
MKSRKATAIGCGVAVLLVALAIGILGYGMFGNHPYYAKDVRQHGLAPASATSIEVFEARNISGAVSLTYLVSEAEFQKFAEEKGWPLSPGSGSIQVHPPSDYFGAVMLKDVEAYLTYEKRQRNGGGIKVIYIPSESRAYIDKSNR